MFKVTRSVAECKERKAHNKGGENAGMDAGYAYGMLFKAILS